ncbi:aminotransferase class I/II-fold pyridoxal phosphate-dependent enzyme [Bacillus cihuensis]|uniref:aminotransferase class I/II-fold pyridoxal phosphate-dependent enzyme n=1 Tax=Bacillus cihuensis TaxID=1208599 RepID=UPI000415AA2E|nr:aminotransferase class I/II-fold pyridoxal phosphate-dependent enzyme [Bacillus cihuensis]
MNQENTPLFDALIRHKEKQTRSFHVPGHKNGMVFAERARSLFDPLLSIDVTEISGLDDLHAPEGPILEAQNLLACLYGVRNSYFLVNGSTVGNMAMILGSLNEGETVLVQRNCHKSVLNGLMLASVKPVFIEPKVDEDWGISEGLQLESVKEAFRLYPQTKAIIVTHPTYYGHCGGLSEIIEFAHSKRIPVLVDEAHGAHLSLGDPFPQSAIEAGADIVVHSAHKTLQAMTMGSYLHINSSLIVREKVEFYLQMLQTSSPSYPIMASLDLARFYLASFGENDKTDLMKNILGFRKELDEIRHIELLKKDMLDPLKITIRSHKNITGFEFQHRLEEKGVFTELADHKNVLLVLPLMKENSSEYFQNIASVIADVVCVGKGEVKNDLVYKQSGLITPLALTYPEMKKRKMQFISFQKSMGMIAAEMVTPYPPGIPLIMMGERITEEQIQYLEQIIMDGSRFHGGRELRNGKLLVYV